MRIALNMRNLVGILLLIFLFISCKDHQVIVESDLSEKEAMIVVKKVTSQKSIPGMYDGEIRYRERWMFELETIEENGELSLILKGYKIDIGPLQTKGIVVGNDNNDVLLSIEVKYPLETNYLLSEFENNIKPRLLYENEGRQQLILLDRVIVLEDIIYPSVAH